MSSKKSNKKPTAKLTPKKKPTKKKIVSNKTVQPMVDEAPAKTFTPQSPVIPPLSKAEDFPAFLRPPYENCCDEHGVDVAECVEQHTPFQRAVKSVKGFLSSLVTAIKHST